MKSVQLGIALLGAAPVRDHPRIAEFPNAEPHRLGRMALGTRPIRFDFKQAG